MTSTEYLPSEPTTPAQNDTVWGFCGESATHREQRLRSDIEALCNPGTYASKFQTQTAQDLAPAIEILRRLQLEAYDDASRVGFDKLRRARQHLDRKLMAYLESGD